MERQYFQEDEGTDSKSINSSEQRIYDAVATLMEETKKKLKEMNISKDEPEPLVWFHIK